MGIRRDINDSSHLHSDDHIATNSNHVAMVSKSTGLPVLQHVDVEEIDSDLIRPLSLMMVREQKALPLRFNNGQLEVAIADPYLNNIIDDFQIDKLPDRNEM